jgi:dipeptide transport system ATP-binding protein
MNLGTPSMLCRDQAVLRVCGLSKQYLQRRPFLRKKIAVTAFQDVSLAIFPGKTLAVVGESGAGKSSLARSIALLERPSAGEIELGGKNSLARGRKQLFAMRRCN